jgi:hypothetical protein
MKNSFWNDFKYGWRLVHIKIPLKSRFAEASKVSGVKR